MRRSELPLEKPELTLILRPRSPEGFWVIDTPRELTESTEGQALEIPVCEVDRPDGSPTFLRNNLKIHSFRNAVTQFELHAHIRSTLLSIGT